jgi:hypothetical protein
MRKVIVCGGRNFNNKKAVFEILDYVKADIVVHGDATGADSLAGMWAKENGKEERAYPANWKLNKRAAGPIRNREMLAAENDESLLGLIAFPGGRGTEDMVNHAKKVLGEDRVLCVEAQND